MDKENGTIFFLSTVGNKNTALYKFKVSSSELKRITYDFPQNMKISSEMSGDEKGNVYFVDLKVKRTAQIYLCTMYMKNL